VRRWVQEARDLAASLSDKIPNDFAAVLRKAHQIASSCTYFPATGPKIDFATSQTEGAAVNLFRNGSAVDLTSPDAGPQSSAFACQLKNKIKKDNHWNDLRQALFSQCKSLDRSGPVRINC
jgi:hypothetical protein